MLRDLGRARLASQAVDELGPDPIRFAQPALKPRHTVAPGVSPGSHATKDRALKGGGIELRIQIEHDLSPAKAGAGIKGAT
jgi:hypothetical protein